jgi:hypothetical protein
MENDDEPVNLDHLFDHVTTSFHDGEEAGLQPGEVGDQSQCALPWPAGGIQARASGLPSVHMADQGAV